jgi:hypothetical protein
MGDGYSDREVGFVHLAHQWRRVGITDAPMRPEQIAASYYTFISRCSSRPIMFAFLPVITSTSRLSWAHEASYVSRLDRAAWAS